MSDFNHDLIADLRANQGHATSGPFVGRPMVILTTVGAKSGATREIPLVYSRDGDRIVIIASMGGAPKNPAWYHNLVKHPDVSIEVGTETIDVTARVPTGEERDRLYAQHAEPMPTFLEYQKRTTRIIPVIVLTRR